MKRAMTVLLAVPLLGLPALAGTASAHPGGTNASGCHAGTQPYHCHGSTPSGPPVSLPIAPQPIAPPPVTPPPVTQPPVTSPSPTTTAPTVVSAARSVTIGIRQAGGVYTFSGLLAPAEPGRQVTVARLDSVTKRVTGVASALTDAAGRYTISTRLPVGTAGFYALTATHGRSRLYGLVVPGTSAPPPAPACSARAPRTSHVGSVDCMFRAYKRGDWAAVANYALPAVIADLRRWRPYDVRTGFPYSFTGCREPQYAEYASSGIACEFYSHPTPGDGMVHGVAIEFSMDRYFRAESITTVG